jgi:hypothetical protein
MEVEPKMENLYNFPPDQVSIFIKNLVTSITFLIASVLAALVGIRSLLRRRHYYGGTRTKAGFYWSPREWSIKPIPAKGGILPGDKYIHYYRVPILLMLLIAPLLGLLYVVLIPFIGFGMLFRCIIQKVYRLGQNITSTTENIPLSNEHHLGTVYPDGGLPIGDEEKNENES